MQFQKISILAPTERIILNFPSGRGLSKTNMKLNYWNFKKGVCCLCLFDSCVSPINVLL